MDRSLEQCLLLYGSKGHATAALLKKMNETSRGLQNMRIPHAGFLLFGRPSSASLHSANRQIIFSSNLHDPERRSFSLYLINVDGTGLERVTYDARFDSFPMFSRDGKKLVFASTKNAAGPREFNIFIADWVR